MVDPDAKFCGACVTTTEGSESVQRAVVPDVPDVPHVLEACVSFEHDGVDEVLTAEQIAALNRSALQMLVRSVVVQGIGTVFVTVLAWWVGGMAAGLSALAGALACTLPNALFALRLVFAAIGIGKGSPVTFFLGEFLKLGATTALLVLVVRLAQDSLVWPALIAGLIVALKSHYCLLLFKNS